MREDAYFANVLNTEPSLFEEKGHLLYTHYDIHPALATLTSSGLTRNNIDWEACGVAGASYEPAAFIVTSSLGRNAGSATIPDFECFEERFTNASAPYVISQDYGGTKYSLFRVHALGDGAYTNTRIKLSVENIQPSTSDIDKYGKFDLVVRQYSDTDLEPGILEAFRGIDLNPSSDKFIGRAVGDMNSYFDFDQKLSSQKIVVKGDHPVKSNYIRVEQSAELYNGQVPKTAIPMGFRGLGHLVTSGSSIMAGIPADGVPAVDVWPGDMTPSDLLRQAVQPPVPLRKNVAVGTSPNKSADSTWYWGIQFMQQQNVEEMNEVTEPDRTISNLSKFFPQLGGSNRDFYVDNNPGAADSSGTVLSCDKFNNNMFSLERIQVRTGSDTWADTEEWASASYVRNGVISADATNKTRALKVDDLKVSGNRTYGKFTFIVQGGFNGSNIFNYDKEHMLDAAAKREIDDSTSQGGTAGPTIAAYRKALDLMGGKSDVDIKLLAIPGLRHSSVTNYAIDTVENRFDAMYIMDIEERDDLNNVVTGSTGAARDLDSINVYNTVTSFKNRALDSSFAAAYFPDTIVVDPNPNIATNVRVPPSVSVLGAFSLNDAVGHPWFAPAGFTRGSLKSVISTKVSLNTDNMNNLYDADINPLTAFPGTGVMVFGQKTLLAQASALDRVNVRRLLINIRRKVRDVANLMLFEPNRQETLDKFNALVQPILQNIQELSGVERFKVVIDSTTTTQADIENNTLRGKIFIQPTRTAEFVSLDFVVTNAGDAFDNA